MRETALPIRFFGALVRLPNHSFCYNILASFPRAKPAIHSLLRYNSRCKSFVSSIPELPVSQRLFVVSFPILSMALVFSLLLEDLSSDELIVLPNSHRGTAFGKLCYVQMSYNLWKIKRLLVPLPGMLCGARVSRSRCAFTARRRLQSRQCAENRGWPQSSAALVTRSSGEPEEWKLRQARRPQPEWSNRVHSNLQICSS